jgi:hypothetical protein
LIHTKVHNWLLYNKLHKLVYVNYNIHIRLPQISLYKRKEDLFDKLMELFRFETGWSMIDPTWTHYLMRRTPRVTPPSRAG